MVAIAMCTMFKLTEACSGYKGASAASQKSGDSRDELKVLQLVSRKLADTSAQEEVRSDNDEMNQE